MRTIESSTALPPGSRVYFRVKDPLLGAGITWQLNTHRSKGDVYGAWRGRRKIFHFSFHESGQTHYAVTAGRREHLEIRATPEELGPRVLFAKRIAVPRSELSPDWAENYVPPDTIDIPTGLAVDGVGLDFYLLEPGVGSVRFERADAVALLERGNGRGFVLLLASPLTLDGPVQETFAELISKRRELEVARGSAVFPFRDVMFGPDPDLPGLQRDIEVLIRA